MLSSKLIDYLIILFIYIVFAVFPYEQIFQNSIFWVVFARLIGLFVAFLVIVLFAKKKSTIHMNNREKHLEKLWWFVPGLLICCSNCFYFIFYPNSFHFTYDNIFIMQIAIQVFTAVIEEYIFRALLHDNLKIENTLLRIVVTSAIFGCFHFVIFFTTFDPVDLIIPLYTFGLGIVLGLIYEYVGCIIASMVFHFLFNCVNSIFFSYSVMKVYFWSFILINAVIALIFIVYFTVIYRFVLIKENK